MPSSLEDLRAALAGHYEIEREIGQGGMATVYLADDLRHERKVAVKVLRPDLAATLGPERFLREIKIAANLTHPHILPLYDSGESNGVLYYVMPYIKGDTLRERIDKEGALPVSEAVRIIKEVTDALAFAHSQGVVHRDIKPDNVMLSGGHAMIMDFGVAKAVSEASSTDKMTGVGLALGTPAYISPEQATSDQHVDHRSDIYSVGAMAYELLAGRPPFQAATPQGVLAAQVTETADPVSKHRDQVSPELEALVMKCLAKKPADRWQSSGEMLSHLEAMMATSDGLTPTSTRAITGSGVAVPRRRVWWMAAGAAAAVVVIAVFGATLLRNDPFTITTSNIRQITRAPGLELDPALSPDGSDVAYTAGPPLKTQLYVRGLGEMATTLQLAQDLSGSLRYPQWNSDGQSLFFCLSHPCQLRQVGKMGGSVRPISYAENKGRQASLSPDGNRIVFAPRNTDSIMVRSVATGDVELLAISPTRNPSSFAWSPDGNSIAFMDDNPAWHRSTSLGNVLASRIWMVDANNGELVPVTATAHMDLSPQWLPDGHHLLFVSDMDGPRDIYVVEVGPVGALGDPQRVTSGGADPHSISVSAHGSRLAYSKFTFRRNIWSVPIPQSGSISITEAEPITSGNQIIESHAPSPDESWIAYDANLGGKQGIYKMPIEGGDPVPLATGSEDVFGPKWSRDGTEVLAYTGGFDPSLVVISADGSIREQMMADNGELDAFPTWSPNGLEIAFGSGRAGSRDIWITSRDSVGGEWGEPVRLTHDIPCFAPTWDPRGAGIACVGGSNIHLVARGGDVRTILTGSDVGLSVDDRSAVFSPHGSIVYFLAIDQNLTQGVWSIPATGGEPRLVVTVDDPSLLIFGISVGADKLYLSIAEYESDIWVMDLEY